MAIDFTLPPEVTHRLVDGADEVHLSRIALLVIEAVREDGNTRRATGLDLP
jgi:hypothetical protein